MSNENFLINDVEIMFPRLTTPVADPFGNVQYEMAIIVDADRAEEISAATGKKSKPQEDGRVMFNFKRKAKRANGEDNGAPRVVDATKQPLDGTKIGNGSRGNVIVYTFDYEYAGSSGRGHSLTAVQVTDLKVYTGGDTVDFDVVDAASGDTQPF